MRKITTAITAAALAFSMLAAAVPAAAVTGYDSAYAGESAFVNITPGQTQNFQVFFANTGTTSWTKGSATQVDLAACLEDKVTCNQLEANKAGWNSGWLSTTRYASTTQTVTPPGSLGTFSYNIMAPTGTAAGIYRFNGDLVLSSTGEKIHPEGYYQEANTGAPSGAATLTSLAPVQGSTNGGTAVTINGSGIVCTPSFPTASFGGTNAVVTSCGATALTAVTPAHASGLVTVTVTNPGGAASNGLSFNYLDTTPPSFTAASVASNVVTVTYSKPVCQIGQAPASDWLVKNVANATTNTVLADNTPLCNAAKSNGVTTANLFLTSAFPPGAFVEVDLLTTNPPATTGCVNNTSCNTHFYDAAGNTINAPQAQTMTATNPSATPPSITSASGAVGSTTVKINFSVAVYCDAAGFYPAFTAAPPFTISSGNATVTDPTFSATAKCGTATTLPAAGTGQQTAGTQITLTTGTALPAGTTYLLTYTSPTGTGAVKNLYNVALPTGSQTTFTTGAVDFTPPIMIDARMTAKNTCSSDFKCSGDSYSLTFSKAMDTTSGSTGTGGKQAIISVQDQDGTTAAMWCGPGPAPAAQGTPTAQVPGPATCTWNAAATTLTVLLTGPMADNLNGTTPGLQIPFNITALSGVTDASGNPVNVLGSTDRLVRYR
jgi:hypothetical protein